MRCQYFLLVSLQNQRGLGLPAPVPLTHTPSLRSNHHRKRPTASPSIYGLRLRLRTSPVTIHSLQLCIGVALSLQTLSTPRGALRLSFTPSSSTATYFICSSTTLPCLPATQAHYRAVVRQSRPRSKPSNPVAHRTTATFPIPEIFINLHI